jgi:hypothetical protein
LSKRSKLFLLSFILVLDVLFFVVVGSMYPQYFDVILDWLPYNNDTETAVILLSGLTLAIASSLGIVQVVLSGLGEVLG